MNIFNKSPRGTKCFHFDVLGTLNKKQKPEKKMCEQRIKILV